VANRRHGRGLGPEQVSPAYEGRDELLSSEALIGRLMMRL